MTKLTYACVLTRHIERVGAFYPQILQLEPRGRPGYLEFETQPGIFSLWSLDDYARTIGATLTEGMAQSGRIMLEFEVQDVDAEYTRLRELADLRIEFVMPPRDLPWGNRSIYFRDPDGNLINVFSRIGGVP